MINAISVMNHSGEILRCELANPDSSGFAITNVDGLTPGQSTVGIKDISTLDGGFFTHARLPSRNIVLSYIFLDYVKQNNLFVYRSIEEARHEFYRYFVIMKPVTLLFETDRHKYTIQGYVESNDPEIFSDAEGAQVSILCPNPYFRLAEDNLDEDGMTSQEIFSQGGSFHFEWSNPLFQKTIEFGDPLDVRTDCDVTIEYDGDVDTGVILTAYVIGKFGHNLIDFTYYGTRDGSDWETTVRFLNYWWRIDGNDELQVGDVLEISTIKGNKYAVVHRGNRTINVLPYVELYDDWIEFRKGPNRLVTHVSAAPPEIPNVYITIRYPTLYAGI